MTPVVIDICCGAGGMSAGLQQAGWEPIGIDKADHPLRYYPFPAYQYDVSQADFALILNALIAKHHPKLIVASPPCQGFGVLQDRQRLARYSSEAHPPQNLVALVRNILAHTQIPFILENVPGVPFLPSKTIQLCGSSFGLRIRRHRLFECHLPTPITPPPCEHDWQNRSRPYIQANGALTGVVTVTGTSHAGTRLIPTQGRQPFTPTTTELARVAMGIDWMPARLLSQAVPPAYGNFIGRQILAALRAEQRARGRASRNGHRSGRKQTITAGHNGETHG
jgi:DNA (cytosine-5)-methyltransferase 1